LAPRASPKWRRADCDRIAVEASLGRRRDRLSGSRHSAFDGGPAGVGGRSPIATVENHVERRLDVLVFGRPGQLRIGEAQRRRWRLWREGDPRRRRPIARPKRGLRRRGADIHNPVLLSIRDVQRVALAIAAGSGAPEAPGDSHSAEVVSANACSSPPMRPLSAA
jgi:hypothetical protein